MVKQLIVVNMAVPMGFSQLTVQIAHASMLGILHQGSWDDGTFWLQADDNPELQTWLKDHFTLIVCKVWAKKPL